MVYKHLVLCCVLCCFLWNSQAQAQDSLALSQLWEQAIQQYPSLEAHKAALRQANLNHKLTRNQYLPQLQLQAQHTLGTYQGMGGAFFPLPGIFNISANHNNTAARATNLVGSAALNWQFIQFGKHRKTVEAAHIQVEQAASALNLEQLEVQASVTRDYIQLLYHQHMQKWATVNVQRFSDMLEVTQSLADAGLSPGADSLLIQASLHQASAEQRSWQGKTAASRIALSQWTDLPSETLGVKQQAFFSSDRLVGADIQWQAHHPVLVLKQQQKAYAQTQMKLSQRKILPDVSLLAGALVRGSTSLAGEGSGNNWREVYQNPHDNYLVGIGLSWNLSNLYDQRLRSSQYQEQVNQQQAELNTAHRELTRQQQAAHTQLEQQRQQIEDAETAYRAARQAYELFEARYRSGLINLTALLQIQQVLQQTEKTRIHAYHQYWLRAVELAESQADFSFLAHVFS